MNPATCTVEQTRSEIEIFVAGCREPVLVEPGEEPVALATDAWAIEVRAGVLTIQAWDETRNIVRRVTAATLARPGRMELAVERFGKRKGTVLLLDRRSARNHGEDLHASRMAFREVFRRSLRRQFPDWRLAELSTEADLEHSLSPAFPRALLRRGTTAWAAIAAPPESFGGEVLTFGLIWLDYLRLRERRLTLEGLAVFLPAGCERVACLRMRHLNPKAATFAAFLYDGDHGEQRLDLGDYGNLDSRLIPASRMLPNQPEQLRAWVRTILDAVPDAAAVSRNDGSLSLRVRGLEFARSTGSQLSFGIESRRPAAESDLAEVIAIGASLAGMRAADARNRTNPLFLKNPEGWLEAQVRTDLQEIDARLLTDPVYGQVPAFTAGDRDVIDLLAADGAGRLNVLELKASEDIHLPLQALDYWMRVKWHADRDEFAPAGYFPGIRLRQDPPRLLLVAPALAFHPSNELVLRYFRSDIEVERIGVGLEWRKKLKVMFRY